MCWWGRCPDRELPSLTMLAPGVWHVYGTLPPFSGPGAKEALKPEAGSPAVPAPMF